MKTLILLRGLPGSGKSSFAESLASTTGASHYEADMFFKQGLTGEYFFDATKLHLAHKWCQDQVETYMKDNQANSQHYPEIIVSNTLTNERELEPYLKLAEEYGYKIVSLIVENRHGSKNVHDCPEYAIVRMRNRFEIKL